MDFSRLNRSELVGFVGAAVLFLSLFLPWFATKEDSLGEINGAPAPDGLNAFGVFGSLDWLLVAACTAPFILAYIIVRGHELSWRPGEITMIVGMIAFALILLNGVILGKPGEPPSESTREIGWYVGLLGSVLLMAGGFIRQGEGGRTRKPPGSVG
ncbi:MAG: hypothetical protein H0V29_02935 [Thermoleophilaceae bacterium]|nr:hypothetical protein [Thermoleophilaceae bacterium]